MKGRGQALHHLHLLPQVREAEGGGVMVVVVRGQGPLGEFRASYLPVCPHLLRVSLLSRAWDPEGLASSLSRFLPDSKWLFSRAE